MFDRVMARGHMEMGRRRRAGVRFRLIDEEDPSFFNFFMIGACTQTVCSRGLLTFGTGAEQFPAIIHFEGKANLFSDELFYVARGQPLARHRRHHHHLIPSPFIVAGEG